MLSTPSVSFQFACVCVQFQASGFISTFLFSIPIRCVQFDSQITGSMLNLAAADFNSKRWFPIQIVIFILDDDRARMAHTRNVFESGSSYFGLFVNCVYVQRFFSFFCWANLMCHTRSLLTMPPDIPMEKLARGLNLNLGHETSSTKSTTTLTARIQRYIRDFLGPSLQRLGSPYKCTDDPPALFIW